MRLAWEIARALSTAGESSTKRAWLDPAFLSHRFKLRAFGQRLSRSYELFNGQYLWTSGVPAAHACSLLPCQRSLSDERTFELRERAKQVEKQDPARALGVDRFLNRSELNALVAEVRDHLDEMGEGPPETVEFPDYERIAAV